MHPDIVFIMFVGKGFGEAQQRMLAGGIHTLLGIALVGNHGADIDNGGVLGSAHRHHTACLVAPVTGVYYARYCSVHYVAIPSYIALAYRAG